MYMGPGIPTGPICISVTGRRKGGERGKEETRSAMCDRSKRRGKEGDEVELELRLSVDSLVFIKQQRQEDSALETNN